MYVYLLSQTLNHLAFSRNLFLSSPSSPIIHENFMLFKFTLNLNAEMSFSAASVAFDTKRKKTMGKCQNRKCVVDNGKGVNFPSFRVTFKSDYKLINSVCGDLDRKRALNLFCMFSGKFFENNRKVFIEFNFVV